MEKYIIEIKKSDSYQETDSRWEGNDGKIYSYYGGIPEGVTAKKVTFETGETKWNEHQIFRQEVMADEVAHKELFLTNIIKAVNEL